MKTRTQCLVSGVVAALTIPFALHAAEPPRCNELFDDAQRLGCYDAVFGKPARPDARAIAPTAPAVPAAAAAAAPVAAAAATTAAVAAPQPAAKPQAAAAKPEKYQSSVKAISEAADGRFVATLDNGQRWLQLERDSRVELKVGDVVTMEPMMFGSWALATKSGYTLRVKRLD